MRWFVIGQRDAITWGKDMPTNKYANLSTKYQQKDEPSSQSTCQPTNEPSSQPNKWPIIFSTHDPTKQMSYYHLNLGANKQISDHLNPRRTRENWCRLPVEMKAEPNKYNEHKWYRLEWFNNLNLKICSRRVSLPQFCQFWIFMASVQGKTNWHLRKIGYRNIAK